MAKGWQHKSREWLAKEVAIKVKYKSKSIILERLNIISLKLVAWLFQSCSQDEDKGRRRRKRTELLKEWKL